jgi:hypothetical protein
MTPVHQALKQKYRLLFETIAGLLFQNDPMGINFGDNTDEYESEAGTILPRLSGARAIEDVQTIVYEEFCRWFGEVETGPSEAYREVSVRIWDAWRAAFPAAPESAPAEE